MRVTWIVAAMATLAVPAGASNMGFKLDRTIPTSPLAHQAAGVLFPNGRVLTIVTGLVENPTQLMSDMFAGSGCTVALNTGKESIDSCAMDANPALACTRFKTSCNLLGYANTSSLGFKEERAVTFLSARSTTKSVEFWDGVWTIPAGRAYVSVEWPLADDEAHATVSIATPSDNGALALLAAPQPLRFIDIPSSTRPAYKVSAKVCSVLLQTGGGCGAQLRVAKGDAARNVFEFPSRILSFP